MEIDRALVTGARGFIGSSLCKSLLTRNDVTVTGIDTVGLEEKLISDRFVELKLDILDEDRCYSLFKEGSFDTIFHLAALANPRQCKDNFALAFKINVQGTQNLLNYSKNS